MTLRIRQIDPDATPSTQFSLEALARVLPPATVEEVVEECCAREQRTRKLCATFVVFFCIAMNLYTSDCLAHVFFRLVSQLRWLWPEEDPPETSKVSKGALSQARYRLGAQPLVALFKRVCSRPLAEPSTPGAFLLGLRLMALDSTILDVPDTPENLRAFGKPGSSRGTSAWPQVRVVALSECATHAICDAAECGVTISTSVPPGAGCCVAWDRGLCCYGTGDSTASRWSKQPSSLAAVSCSGACRPR
jgi:hypothetical protein